MKAFRFILTIFFIALAAQAIGFRLLFILDYILIGLLIFSLIWAKVSLIWLNVTRQGLSDRAQVGNQYEEIITLHNTSFLPKLWLEIFDNSELPGHRVNCVQKIGPFGQVSWKISSLCVLRGCFQTGPITISAGDPFGIFRFKRNFNDARSLTVYPSTFDITQFETLSGLLTGGSAVNQASYHTTPNFNGLREYRPGDSLNRIHWASSARFNKLVVKEFEFDPIINLQIILDLQESRHWVIEHNANSGQAQVLPASSGVRSIDSTEEYAVTAAATLSRYYLEAGRNLGLIAWGQHHEVIPPDRGERQLEKIKEALAVIRAKGTTDLGELIAAEINKLRNSNSLILITSSVDENWILAIPLLLRKNVKIAVVLVEPATFGAPVENSLYLVGALAAMDIPVYLLKRGDEMSQALNSELARITSKIL